MEQTFSPQQSPRSSPFKGIKAVADERLALKRGKVQGNLHSPRKVQKVSREMAVASRPVISGVRPSIADVSTVREYVRPSVVEKRGG